jgi:hypothetical protein
MNWATAAGVSAVALLLATDADTLTTYVAPPPQLVGPGWEIALRECSVSCLR